MKHKEKITERTLTLNTATYRARLIDLLSDPDVKFPKRIEYPELLGITKKTLYRNFAPADLLKIEIESVELRKQRSVRQRSCVLQALYKRAIGYTHHGVRPTLVDGEIIDVPTVTHYPPDKASAQEFFDRTEGKVLEKLKVESGGPDIKRISEEMTEDEAREWCKNVLG